MSTVEQQPDRLAEWFGTPLGAYLLERELDFFDRTVADVFGFNALQLGLAQFDLLRASRIASRWRVAPEGNVELRSDFHDLPIAANSVDLVVMPHVLEFTHDPHQILREVVRVLVPDGQLVISGFNPWSLWGAKRLLPKARREMPWCGHFVHLPRLKDWLSLLSFDIATGRMHGYLPPFSQERWLRRFRFMDAAGDRWWPFGGGVYFLQAVKRVRGMRLITPKWSRPFAVTGNVVALRRVPGSQRTSARKQDDPR